MFLYNKAMMSRSLAVSHQLLACRCCKPFRSTATAVHPVLMDHPLAVCGVSTKECRRRSVPHQAQRFLHSPAAARLGRVYFPQSHFTERQQQQSRRRCAAVRLFQSASEYNAVADECLENLQDALDDWLEENVNNGTSSDDTTEVVYASGVLTLKLPPHGTWVLNKQSATQQIWWSSPLSGPKRFEYADGAWWSTKDGLNLERQLAQELRHFFPHAASLKNDDGEEK